MKTFLNLMLVSVFSLFLFSCNLECEHNDPPMQEVVLTDSWVNDRSAPTNWKIENSSISFGTSKVYTDLFYRWFGKGIDVNMPLTDRFTVETTLYVDRTTNVESFKSIWVNLIDAGGRSYDYSDCLIGFYTSEDNSKAVWKVYYERDRDSQWTDVPVYNTKLTSQGYHNIKITFNNGRVEYHIDNVMIYHHNLDKRTVRVSSLILNSESFRSEYTTTWTIPVIKYQ